MLNLFKKRKYKYEVVGNINKEILKNEINGIKTFAHHLTKASKMEIEKKENTFKVFIIAKGDALINGTNIFEKGICAFAPTDDVIIEAKNELSILEINVTGDMDNADINKLPYFLNYNDAVTYKEDCKSEKTINRFLLKQRIIPNLAIGSVETSGPDKVGVHEHPDVEQLFYSFNDNNCKLVINNNKVKFENNTLFHIPLASNHGVDIQRSGKAHYVWIDYIINEKGLEYMDEAHQL